MNVIVILCEFKSCVCVGVLWSPQHIMKRHISSAVQSLHLIAHVLKQQLVFVQVHLQPAPQQPEQELHSGCWDHTLGEDGVNKETVA